MIQGSNAYIEIRPRVNISLVAEMVFSFFAGKTRTLILQKRYPEDVTEINGKLYLGLTQEDTVRLYQISGNGYVELETQVNLKDKSVIQQPQRGIRLYRRRAVEIVDGNSPRYDMPDTVIDIVTGDMVLVKGKDGAPGTSVAVASVTESEESGGENVVEFTDGKKLKVKNGKDIKPLIVTLTPNGNENTYVSSHSSEEITKYVDNGGSSLCVLSGSGMIGTLAAINEGKVSYRYSEHAVEEGCAFVTAHIVGNTALLETEIYPKHLRVDITTTGNSAVLKTSHSAEEIIQLIKLGGSTTAKYGDGEYILYSYSNIGDTYYVRYATMRLYRNDKGEAVVGQSLITINGNDVSEDGIIHALPFVRTGRGPAVDPDTGLGQIEGFAGEFYQDEDTGKVYLCTGDLSWVLLNKDVNLDDVLKFTKQSLTDEQQKQARANIGTEKETVSGYVTIPASVWKNDSDIFLDPKEMRIRVHAKLTSDSAILSKVMFGGSEVFNVTPEWQKFTGTFTITSDLEILYFRVYGGPDAKFVQPYDIANVKIYRSGDTRKKNLVNENIAKFAWWMYDSVHDTDRLAVAYSEDGVKYLHVFRQGNNTTSAAWASVSNETADVFPAGTYVLEFDMRTTCNQLYCTMPLDGIRDASATIITPTETSKNLCINSGVRGFAQRIGEISFTADTKPTADITVAVNASYGKGGSMVTVYDRRIEITGTPYGKPPANTVLSFYGTHSLVDSKTSSHNTSESAHSDIRNLITDLTTRLNALADSDDTTLDQLSEIIAYIKSNKDLIDAVTTSKVSVADIIDNLETNVSDQPLSARMGMELKRLIDAIQVPDSPVQSVNGKTGEVKLTASDVGAASAGSVAELKAEVDELELSVGNSETVPEYVRAAAEETADTVNKHQSQNSIVFAFVCDAHCGWYKDTANAAIIQASQALGIIAKRAGIDFMVHGGDMANGAYDTTRDLSFEQVQCYSEIMGDAVRDIPSIWCVGNHDDSPYQATEERLTQTDTYALIGRRNLKSGGSQAGGCNYGYFDFENRKLRVIYLDTDDKRSWGTTAVGAGETAPEYLNAHNIGGAQLMWLAGIALDFTDKASPSEWGVLVVSHTALNIAGTVTDAVSGKEYANSTANAAVIIGDYRKGKSGSLTHNGITVTYDFSSLTERAEVYCAVHGHNHAYIDEIVEGVVSVGCPNAMNGRERESADGNTYTKTEGEAEGTSFCIITVDRQNNMIYADHYGAGYDREWVFTPIGEYKYTNQIPISTDSNGDIYNGIGYKGDTYISSSSGGDSSRTGYYATGYIPAADNDVVYLSNVKWVEGDNYSRLVLYDSNKVKITNGSTAGDQIAAGVGYNPEFNENGCLTKFVLGSSYCANMAYFRLCGQYIGEDSVVTLNEEIV